MNNKKKGNKYFSILENSMNLFGERYYLRIED